MVKKHLGGAKPDSLEMVSTADVAVAAGQNPPERRDSGRRRLDITPDYVELLRRETGRKRSDDFAEIFGLKAGKVPSC